MPSVPVDNAVYDYAKDSSRKAVVRLAVILLGCARLEPYALRKIVPDFFKVLPRVGLAFNDLRKARGDVLHVGSYILAAAQYRVRKVAGYAGFKG